MGAELVQVIDGVEVWVEGTGMYTRPALDHTLPDIVKYGLKIRMEAALGGSSCVTEGCPGGTIQQHSLDCPANGRNPAVEEAMGRWAREHPKKYRRLAQAAIKVGTLIGGAEFGVLTREGLDDLAERVRR